MRRQTVFEQLTSDVRVLDADSLDIGVKAKAKASHASSAPDAPDISEDHPLIQEIIRLAKLKGGVILAGPPGTSKSYYAAAAGQIMADFDKSRYRFVQFHASYQYEDFMLGFSPTKDGFISKRGPFLQLVNDAEGDTDKKTYVLIIDELSRADVGRVFGEALTYVERSKRELPFQIANGETVTVPSNFVIIATMNPFDRGVDEVDAAFERRFAKITMDPDREILDEILKANEMDEALKSRVIGWFNRINSHTQTNPAAAVGHAYFSDVADESDLSDLWEYQLKYLVQRAFRRDGNTREAIENGWAHIFQPPAAALAKDVADPEPQVD